MFFQLALGNVVDTEGARREWDRWATDLAPAATGWLGSTGGITTDGRLMLVAAFESAEAATANDGRPEQVEWWSAVEPLLDGPPTRLETEDVTVERVTDSSPSRFVQAMRAGVRDRARWEEVEARIGPAFIAHRPDFLTGYRLWLGDGTLVALDYFSSEAEARAGEAKALPDHLSAGFQEWFSLLVAPEWYDLPDPWLVQPA